MGVADSLHLVKETVLARRPRSKYFIATGAVGGFVGFALMELLGTDPGFGGSLSGNILRMAFYFGGYGLAVGACLGMTEGLILHRPKLLAYGLTLGLILGAVGGALGGALGQSVFGLLPIRYQGQSTADLAIALDSSGSMRQLLFWGNDPWGKRKDAAQELIERLSPTDRVAVVDFDLQGTVLLPLTFLSSADARARAKQAVSAVDSSGGTSLTAGLSAAVGALDANPAASRDRFVIFLTDGIGAFDPSIVERARAESITVYTIGLGSGVDAALLDQAIARPTGGQYFPVQRADDLVDVFDRIYTERIAMNSGTTGAPDARQTTSPLALLLFRIGSWALMGLVIGLGQGVRENTREDLKACGFGGFIGGLVGGLAFEPLSHFAGIEAGALSRLLADCIVGACIGGSMRLVQERFVDALPKTTRLSDLLPKRGQLASDRSRSHRDR